MGLQHKVPCHLEVTRGTVRSREIELSRNFKKVAAVDSGQPDTAMTIPPVSCGFCVALLAKPGIRIEWDFV